MHALLLISVLGAISLLTLSATAEPAVGHSELKSSTPAQGATLAAAPQDITLVFNQDISSDFANLALLVDAGDPVPLTPRVDGPRIVAAIPAEATVASGGPERVVSWQVNYRVVSADGHPITGSVMFRAPLSPPQTTSPSAQPSASPVVPSGPESPSPSPAATPGVAAPPMDPTRGEVDQDEETGAVATLVIGAIAAAVALSGGIWLARRRNQGFEE